MVYDVASQSYENDCKAHACNIEISVLMGELTAEIEFVSLSRSVLIRYKDMEYKVSRNSSDDFEYICMFILNQLTYDIFNVVVSDVREDDDEAYNYVCLKKNNGIVFKKHMMVSNFTETVLEFMMPLRFMN